MVIGPENSEQISLKMEPLSFGCQAGTEQGNILDTFSSLLNFCQLCIWYFHKSLVFFLFSSKNETSFPFFRKRRLSLQTPPLLLLSPFLLFDFCTSLSLQILGFGSSQEDPGMGRVALRNVIERLLYFNHWSSTENFEKFSL